VKGLKGVKSAKGEKSVLFDYGLLMIDYWGEKPRGQTCQVGVEGVSFCAKICIFGAGK